MHISIHFVPPSTFLRPFMMPSTVKALMKVPLYLDSSYLTQLCDLKRLYLLSGAIQMTSLRHDSSIGVLVQSK